MVVDKARGVLALAVLSCTPPARAQDSPFAVLVYKDHFEVRDNRFESAQDLRSYLDSLIEVTTGVHIRECGADELVREAAEVISQIAARRAVGAGPSAFIGIDFASVACPRS